MYGLSLLRREEKNRSTSSCRSQTEKQFDKKAVWLVHREKKIHLFFNDLALVSKASKLIQPSINENSLELTAVE